MDIFDFDDYRLWLKEEIETRMRRNPRFSLSAFAKKIGISQSMLSLVLSGKRNLSKQRLGPIAAYLSLNELQKHYLLLLVQHDQASEKKERNRIKRERDELRKHAFTLRKVQDGTRPFSAWHYNLLFAATDLTNISRTPKVLARHLGFTQSMTESALDLLLRLGLVLKVGDEFHANKGAQSELPENMLTQSMWKICQSIIEQSMRLFEKNHLSVDIIRGRVIATNPTQIKLAHEKIKNFLLDLDETLQQGERTTLVQYSLQLFDAYPV